MLALLWFFGNSIDACFTHDSARTADILNRQFCASRGRTALQQNLLPFQPLPIYSGTPACRSASPKAAAESSATAIPVKCRLCKSKSRLQFEEFYRCCVALPNSRGMGVVS